MACFVFSLEAEKGNDGFVLRSTGRYAHSLGYTNMLAEANGLQEVYLETDMLRTDKGQPIDGYLVVLMKPTAFAGKALRSGK